MRPVRVELPERHLRPSQRLLVGIAVLAAGSTFLLWGALGRWAFAGLGLWAVLWGWAASYVARSWVRISPGRGLSYCLCTKGPGRAGLIGSVELHPSEIAEFRLEAGLGARMMGLWDLQIVKRDGTQVPKFRYFEGMDRVAEELHGYLQQS